MLTHPKKAPPPSATPPESTHETTLEDGSRLFYRAWLPATPTRDVLVMFHRGHEHSGRLADVVEALGMTDVAVFAWDARGHGRSEGDRGYAPSFGQMVRDVDTFVRHVCEHHGFAIEDMVVLAHSVGGVTVTTWVHDFAPRIRALVLATPAFKVKLYVPFAIPGLRLLLKIKRGGKAFVKSYVKAKMLTHDPEQARRYDEDELIARSIAVNVLLGMHDAAKRVVADAAAIRVPTLLLSGGADWVVSTKVQQRFFDNLGSPTKKMRFFEKMYHDVLHEKDRHEVIDEIRAFLRSAFGGDLPRREPLLDADERGYTKDEFDRLSRPLPTLSPKGLSFAFQRLVLGTIAKLGRGVRLGHATGFDSGRTLDYVYANESAGSLLIGKWFDRIYLDSLGWRGIRQRKHNLEQHLATAIRAVAASGTPIRILDIATGAGRYVLDAMKSMRSEDASLAIEALLRDFTEGNLETGRATAAAMQINGVRFEQGDAFDEESVASAEPAPNVVIVSGLYELFPDNRKVLTSLRGVARALRAGGGGQLIYTGQPWHPQLEMIARVLPNREGVPWAMRRRTQEELDDLVGSVGFTKQAMSIDEWGIFTVSRATITAE